MEKEEIIQILKNIPFFSTLSEENFREFAEHFIIKKFSKGDVICLEGDPGDFFYIVKSGKVKITKGKEGAEKTLAIIKEGDFFGEMALVTDEPRSATVTAVEAVEAIALSKADFDKFLEKSPQIALSVTKVISRRLAASQKGEAEREKKKVNIISIYSVKERMGKTTLAVNLALILAKNFNKKVALLDLDLQYGDVIFTLNVKPERTIFELIQKSEIDSDLLESALTKCDENLKVLSAPFKIEQAERVQENHIKQILSILKENYEYVIIDTSSNLNSITVGALDDSTLILFLLAPDLLVLKNTKSCLELFKTLAYSPEKVKIGLASLSLGQIEINQKKIEEIIERKIEFTIPQDAQVSQSYVKGIPLFTYNPKSTVISSIVELIKSISGEEIEKETGGEKASLFKGIFGKKK